MQAALPLPRSLLSGVKTQTTATGGPGVASRNDRIHGQQYTERLHVRTRTPHADRLVQLRNELALLLMQTREIMERGARILEVENLHPDIRRDVLHLCARVDGVLWQMEDIMQIAERPMNHPARDRNGHRGGCIGTPMNPF